MWERYWSEKHRSTTSIKLHCRIISRVYRAILSSSSSVSRPLAIKRCTFLPLSATINCIVCAEFDFNCSFPRLSIKVVPWITVLYICNDSCLYDENWLIIICHCFMHQLPPLLHTLDTLPSPGRGDPKADRDHPQKRTKTRTRKFFGQAQQHNRQPMFLRFGQFLIFIDIFSPIFLSLIACIYMSLDVRCRNVKTFWIFIFGSFSLVIRDSFVGTCQR